MERKIDAVIVGGSIAGLMHGVVLKALGYDVLILEARQAHHLKVQAAGLSLGPDGQKLINTYVSEGEAYAIANATSQFLDADGEVVREIPLSSSVVTSSWSIVFEKLKAEFETEYEGKAKTSYLTRRRVTGIEDNNDLVKVTYRNDEDNAEESVSAMIVVAADGARSAIRRLLMPDVQPDYAGYLAWRGCIPEAQMPDAFGGALEGKLVMNMLKGSYILAYLTPGPTGSMKQGDRLLDWCWYDDCDAESSDFVEIMTDATGRLHNHTVPRGCLSEVVWNKRLAHADTVLPEAWRAIVGQAKKPFVTAITSFETSKATLFGGKVLLAGEAFTQFRPHMGLSSNLAAFQALALVEVLGGKKTVNEWEKEVVEYAAEYAMRSKAMGHFGMTGKWPEGYVPLYLRKTG